MSQADCPRCGRRLQAHRPPAYHSGDGPRRSARIQTWCASVLGLPLGLGAIQQVLDRVPLALPPPYAAMARLARHAPVGARAATPGLCQGTLQWRWGLTSPQGACSRIDPSRAKVACAALMDDWDGIVVREGYVSPLSRQAPNLSGASPPAGAWLRPAHRPTTRRLRHAGSGGVPTSGSPGPFRLPGSRAGSARLCDLLHRDQERQDEAGPLVRPLRRAMDALWVFLLAHGVETTNNRSERA